MRRKNVAGVIGAIAAVGLMLGGCSNATPGAVAIVGDDRISDRQLNEQVEQVLKAQGRPLDSASDALVATTLDRMVTASLVNQFAEANGIEVTDGELDATLAMYAEANGGQLALENALVEQGVAPEAIPEIIRVNILAQKIGAAADPTGTPESQSQAIFVVITDYSAEIGTTVSPRYGTWDPIGLAVGGVPNDLSVPVEAL